MDTLLPPSLRKVNTREKKTLLWNKLKDFLSIFTSKWKPSSINPVVKLASLPALSVIARGRGKLVPSRLFSSEKKGWTVNKMEKPLFTLWKTFFVPRYMFCRSKLKLQVGFKATALGYQTSTRKQNESTASFCGLQKTSQEKVIFYSCFSTVMSIPSHTPSRLTDSPHACFLSTLQKHYASILKKLFVMVTFGIGTWPATVRDLPPPPRHLRKLTFQGRMGRASGVHAKWLLRNPFMSRLYWVVAK